MEIKIIGVPSGEKGTETKLQDIMTFWIVKADYLLELWRNLKGEERREGSNLRSKMGIFLCKGDLKTVVGQKNKRNSEEREDLTIFMHRGFTFLT